MEVVAGPQQTPPRVSLISSAETINVSDARWQDGFIADLDGHGGASTFPVCPAEEDELTFQFGATGGVLSYKPYVLYATDKASTYGTGDDVRKFYDRAQRKLLAGESKALEQILWAGYSGALNQNPFLADGAGDYASAAGNDAGCTDSASPTMTITSDVTDVEDALALLEQSISSDSGSRGMIHMRPMAFHRLVQESVVRREGNVWLSPLDNIVVPGRGYPGTGPAGQAVGATEWMYGHAGVVQVRRGDIVRLGEDDLASQINRGWNDRQVVVQRAAHVLLDPTAQVYAIDFNSLGAYSATPSIDFGVLEVTASTTADQDTSTLYGWNLVNGAVSAATITLVFNTDEEIVINLAGGESVTYMLPSPIAVDNVEYTSGAGITGSIFIGS